MKRLWLFVTLLLSTSVWGGPFAAAAPKPNAAEFTVNVHVSSAQYVGPNGLSEILSVVIDGRHYQLQGPTSSAKLFVHGNGLLNPGDYPAKLTADTHKTPFESEQTYEFLLPDGSTRAFDVIFQGE